MVRVLPERHIAHIMHTVFNHPMRTPPLRQHRRRSVCRRNTGQGVARGVRHAACPEHTSRTHPLQHLLHARPGEVAIQIIPTMQTAVLEPPMPVGQRAMRAPWTVTGQRRRVDIPPQILLEVRVIAVDHHPILPAPRQDVSRTFRVGQARIQRHQHAAQIASGQ